MLTICNSSNQLSASIFMSLTKNAGSTYGSLHSLSLSLQSTPPTISEDDAHKGLLSLIERQLIPVSFTSSPSHVTVMWSLACSRHRSRPSASEINNTRGEFLHKVLISIILPPFVFFFQLLSASQQHARATVAVAQDGKPFDKYFRSLNFVWGDSIQCIMREELDILCDKNSITSSLECIAGYDSTGCGHMVGVRLAPDHVIPASASESRQEATPTTPQSATRQPRLNFQLLPVPNLFDQSSEQV